jgi:hypothetical protein
MKERLPLVRRIYGEVMRFLGVIRRVDYEITECFRCAAGSSPLWPPEHRGAFGWSFLNAFVLLFPEFMYLPDPSWSIVLSPILLMLLTAIRVRLHTPSRALKRNNKREMRIRRLISFILSIALFGGTWMLFRTYEHVLRARKVELGLGWLMEWMLNRNGPP